MTKQSEFANPPGGHVGLLTYDSVSGKWYAVLGDADGKIQIEVTEIALPSGAATAAKQLADNHQVSISNASLAVTGTFYPGTQPISAASLPLPSGAAKETTLDSIKTAVEKIDDLQGALDSVGTDELDVNIEDSVTLTVQSTDSDKIFSFESIVAEQTNDLNLSAGTNTLDSPAVPSGKIWVITNIELVLLGTLPTGMVIANRHDGSNVNLKRITGVVHPDSLYWSGHAFMDESDVIRGTVYGATATDDLYLTITGYQMDAP